MISVVACTDRGTSVPFNILRYISSRAEARGTFLRSINYTTDTGSAPRVRPDPEPRARARSSGPIQLYSARRPFSAFSLQPYYVTLDCVGTGAVST